MNTLSACVSMLQPERSATYVLATNHIEPVRNFVTMAFDPADIELAWDCEDEQEIAVDRATGWQRVRVNPKLFRPAEVDVLTGNPKRVHHELGWRAGTLLEDLCRLMVEADMRRNRNGFSR